MKRYLLLFLLLCSSAASAQTIADKLTTVNAIKLGIKSALASKSQTVGDDFSLYDDAVASISEKPEPETLPAGIEELTATSTVTPASVWTDAADAYILSIAYCGNGVAVAGVYDDGRIIRSTDYGITWSTATDVTGIWAPFAATYCGSNTVLIAGNSSLVIRSTNNGVSWSPSTPFAGETECRAMKYIGSSTVLAGTGPNGKLWRSLDRGATWDASPVDTSYATVHCITNAGNGVAFASLGGTGATSVSVQKTEDWGVSYTEVSTLANASQANCLQYLGGNRMIAGTGPDGKLYYSDDLGINWSLASDTTEAGISRAVCCENGLVYIGTTGNGWILRSVDYGHSWSLYYDTARQYITTGEYCGAGIVLLGAGADAGNSTVYRLYGDYLDSDRWRP